MANSVKQTLNLEVSGLASVDILNGEGVQQLAVTLGLLGNVVVENLNLGVRGRRLAMMVEARR